jgi:hypothetical protein
MILVIFHSLNSVVEGVCYSEVDSTILLDTTQKKHVWTNSALANAIGNRRFYHATMATSYYAVNKEIGECPLTEIF